jgi:Lytic transglycolase
LALRRTANGERYDMHGISAAHRTMPLPSYVRVTNLDNGRSIIVRVNNRTSPWVLNLRTCTCWPLGCLASTYHSSPTLTGSANIDHGWGAGLSPLLPIFFGRRIRGICRAEKQGRPVGVPGTYRLAIVTKDMHAN